MPNIGKTAFSFNQPTSEKLREDVKFEGRNNSRDSNSHLPNVVAMDSRGNNNKNREEKRKSTEDTEDKEREKGWEPRRYDNQAESEAEEKNLLQLKRALFKHDQINEVPGEKFYKTIHLLNNCQSGLK